mgnify:CR=1 FL=1
MGTSSDTRAAVQFYEGGLFLADEGRYEEALAALDRAEEAFRRLEADIRPCRIHLSSGVSGLAETLKLKGICFQTLGDWRRAAESYETSVINSRFEKKRPFSHFCKTMTPLLIACYERLAEEQDPEATAQDIDIDISYMFPFSMPSHLIPPARLYELDPTRFRLFEGTYIRAREKDLALRRGHLASIERTSKAVGIAIWVALTALWVLYGYAVAKTLFGI